MLLKFPSIQTFSWCQYTPYFNDGAECTFTADTSYHEINGRDSYGERSEELDDEVGEEVEALEEWTPEEEAASKEITNIFNMVPEQIIKDMFGDHVRVTYTRGKGFSTEEYEHE